MKCRIVSWYWGPGVPNLPSLEVSAWLPYLQMQGVWTTPGSAKFSMNWVTMGPVQLPLLRPQNRVTKFCWLIAE